MGERAREVHPDLHPMTYVILAHLAASGPLRGADRRAILLHATDEGRMRLAAMSRSRSQRLDQRLAGWGDAELAAFAAQLAAYNSALSET